MSSALASHVAGHLGARGGRLDAAQLRALERLQQLFDELQAFRAARSSPLKRLLTSREYWQECSDNGVMGVREHYVWSNHCSLYTGLGGQ